MLALASAAFAVVELEPLSTELLQKRYNSLIEELRCPKCQNQNLAGSDSMIAQDLRREVRIMLEAGRSDTEIKDFLVARYGDFVLYRPPLSGVTLWVWVLPAVVFLLGMFAAVLVIRKAMSSVDGGEVVDEDRIENNSGDVS
ncbi:UNVERIFIED_CONTAM: hypothetical protein GTU68_008036 [Idotea baltica]|nr:hypothetical protein [Idotea baltica]